MNNTLFYIDELTKEKMTYNKLISSLKKVKTYNPYCKSESYTNIFVRIVLSMLLGKEIILLDSDFSKEEIKNLTGKNTDFKNFDQPITENLENLTLQSLQEHLFLYQDTWKITLFTSGTTGIPKKISHTLSSISRFVKKSERHTNDIWGFAYNPTHMAGLQVFFQALLNGNPIIRLFGMKRENILKNIQQHKVTHISATPTFYRLLLPADHICNSVQRLTSGGEKFDLHTSGLLHHMFPRAKYTNIYASTEAGTLFASKGDIFNIKPGMKNLFKLIDNELYLHRSLMGISESIQLNGDWYATGDLIKVISENPFTFKFISRKNEMINVGGYKVNPNEVEEAIRTYPDVQDVFIYGKKNRLLGNIICGEVVCRNPEIKETVLRNYLATKLQEYKIPRIITFVDKLQTTRTGKISRIK